MLLHLITLIQTFHRDDRGLTIVEYCVAGALISLAVVLAFTALGDQAEVVIDGLTDAITP